MNDLSGYLGVALITTLSFIIYEITDKDDFTLNRDEIIIGVVKQKVGDNLEVEDINDKKIYNIVKNDATINDTIYLNK